MSKVTTGLSLREAIHLQALAGNPLDAEDIAMFEMFERERWPAEKCLAHIHAQVEHRRNLGVGR